MKSFCNKTHDGERSRDAYDSDKDGWASQPRFVHDRGAFVDVAWLLGPMRATLLQ